MKKIMSNPITWIGFLFLLLYAWPLAMIKVVFVTGVGGVIGALGYRKGKRSK